MERSNQELRDQLHQEQQELPAKGTVPAETARTAGLARTAPGTDDSRPAGVVSLARAAGSRTWSWRSGESRSCETSSTRSSRSCKPSRQRISRSSRDCEPCEISSRSRRQCVSKSSHGLAERSGQALRDQLHQEQHAGVASQGDSGLTGAAGTASCARPAPGTGDSGRAVAAGVASFARRVGTRRGRLQAGGAERAETKRSRNWGPRRQRTGTSDRDCEPCKMNSRHKQQHTSRSSRDCEPRESSWDRRRRIASWWRGADRRCRTTSARSSRSCKPRRRWISRGCEPCETSCRHTRQRTSRSCKPRENSWDRERRRRTTSWRNGARRNCETTSASGSSRSYEPRETSSRHRRQRGWASSSSGGCLQALQEQPGRAETNHKLRSGTGRRCETSSTRNSRSCAPRRSRAAGFAIPTKPSPGTGDSRPAGAARLAKRTAATGGKGLRTGRAKRAGVADQLHQEQQGSQAKAIADQQERQELQALQDQLQAEVTADQQ